MPLLTCREVHLTWVIGSGCRYSEALLAPLLTLHCVARFLTGHSTVLVHGPGAGDPFCIWSLVCFRNLPAGYILWAVRIYSDSFVLFSSLIMVDLTVCTCFSYRLFFIYLLHVLVKFEFALQMQFLRAWTLFTFPLFYPFSQYALCSFTNISNKCQNQDKVSFDAD